MSVKMQTTCTWIKRPYEASLFPRIGFGPFLCSLGGRRRRPPSRGVQAVSLLKGNIGMQWFSRAGRRLTLECKGRRELDCKTHSLSKDEWKGCRSTDKSYSRDNRLILPK
ncbi:hypothetical protein NC652_036886 [Populus alba x Populus x berolinensis]|nr:hypothetical protein NC652_036886 [Populus alba x Populus x berolinensis]